MRGLFMATLSSSSRSLPFPLSLPLPVMPSTSKSPSMSELVNEIMEIAHQQGCSHSPEATAEIKRFFTKEQGSILIRQTSRFAEGVFYSYPHPDPSENGRSKNLSERIFSFLDNQTYSKALPCVSHRWKLLMAPFRGLPRLFTEFMIIGTHDGYSIKRSLNRRDAESILKQTGLVIPIHPGESLIENYRLGKGEFGEFVAGHAWKRDQSVGIKITLGNDEAESEAMIQRVLSSNPHILPASDMCKAITPNGEIALYQVMELAGLGSAENLGSHFAKLDKLFKEQILFWLSQGLLKGLSEMHIVGFCHLDIKPSNIVVTHDGRVLLIDFGCAGLLRDLNLKKMNGYPAYFSPERWLAERFVEYSNSDGCKVDVWAAGLSLLVLGGYATKDLFAGMQTIIKKGGEKEEVKKAIYLYVQNQLSTIPILHAPASNSFAAFVLSLLTFDPKMRPDPMQALKHAWCRETALSIEPHKTKITGYLREFVQTEQRLHTTPKKIPLLKPRFLALSPQELPPAHFTSFIPRAIPQSQLEKELFSWDLSAYHKKAPLIPCQGAAGVGKSSFLAYMVHQPKVKERFGLILWFHSSDSSESLISQCVTLAQELNLIEENSSTEFAIAKLHAYLADYPSRFKKPWLAVFDNVEDESTLKPFLPLAGGHVIITTRSNTWREAICVDVLTEKEGQELVEKLLFQKDPHGLDLCQTLGFLTLGIVQACAYIRQHEMAIPVYLEHLSKSTALLEKTELLFGKELPTSILGLWKMTLDTISSKSVEAFTLLESLAYMAPDNLSQQLLNHFSSKSAQDLLKRYGLLQGLEVLSIHRLLQQVVRAKHTLDGQIAHLENNMTILAQAYNRFGFDPRIEQTNRQLLPHGQSMLVHYKNLAAPRKLLKGWVDTLLWMDYAQEVFTPTPQRLALLEKARLAAEEAYGKEHIRAADVYHQLGGVYVVLDKCLKGKQLIERALAIRKNVYGVNHHLVAMSLSLLGAAWSNLGDPIKVIEPCEQARAIFQGLYGEGHPFVANANGRMANALSNLGDAEQALICYKKALKSQIDVWGEESLVVAATLNNLGLFLKQYGELEDSFKAYEGAYEIIRQKLGEEHPMTALSLHNLGMTWIALNKPARALQCLKKADDIRVKHFGASPPPVIAVSSLNGLAQAWFMLGNYPKSLEVGSRALEILEKAGAEGFLHTNLMFTSTLNSQALAWESLGNPQKALECGTRALSILENAGSDKYLEMATLCSNLSKYAQALHNFPEAIAYETKSLVFLKVLYPEGHPLVAQSLEEVGLAYKAAGNLKRAAACFLQAYEMALRLPALGKNHSDTRKYSMHLKRLKSSNSNSCAIQ